MQKLFGRAVVFALAAAPLFGGYGYESIVAFTGATGSTQTGITLAFRFNDAKLKTAANGGQIQNLCTRNTYSVPCDFVFTNDSTCATETGGYTWGFDGDYSATAGTGHGWVMIPSYTTGGVTPTVCIGNATVTTYQGGAAGAEFDSNTISVWHMPDTGGVDFAGSNTLTNHSATATTGQIDGGAAFSGSSQYITTPLTNLSYAAGTVCWWASTTAAFNDTVDHFFWGQQSSGEFSAQKYNDGNFYVGWNKSGDERVVVASSALTFPLNTWANYCFTWVSGGTSTLYFNGASIGTHTGTAVGNVGGALQIGAENGAAFWKGSQDEYRIDQTNRSANWIATQYANQNAPPVIGAFTAISGSGPAPVVPAAIY